MIPLDTISLSSLKLKGDVKQVTTLMLRAANANGTVQEGDQCHEDFAYIDQDSPEGSISDCSYSYRFDQSRRIIYGKLFSIEQHFSYNKQGQLIKMTKQNLDNNIDIAYRPLETVSFNYTGQNVSSAMFYKNNQFSHKQQYQYDARNNLIAITNIDKENNVVGTLTAKFEYDAAGRLIGKEYCEPGLQPRTIRYEYDAQGRIVSEVSTDHFGGKYTRNYPIEEEQPQPYVYGIPTYNDESEIVAWQAEADSSEKFTYRYTYDRNGNWVRITEYKNGVLTLIRKRTIEYYR